MPVCMPMFKLRSHKAINDQSTDERHLHTIYRKPANENPERYETCFPTIISITLFCFAILSSTINDDIMNFVSRKFKGKRLHRRL